MDDDKLQELDNGVSLGDDWLLTWSQQFEYLLQEWETHGLATTLTELEEHCIELAKHKSTGNRSQAWIVVRLMKMAFIHCNANPLTREALTTALYFFRQSLAILKESRFNDAAATLESSFTKILQGKSTLNQNSLLGHFQKACSKLWKATNLNVKESSEQDICNECLEVMFQCGYEIFESRKDLELLICVLKKRLVVLEPRQGKQPSEECLQHYENLARAFGKLFNRLAKVEYLEEGLSFGYKSITGGNDIIQLRRRLSIAETLMHIGEQRSSTEDLAKALTIIRTVQPLLQEKEHTGLLTGSYDWLARALGETFDLTGGMHFLIEAIEAAEKAITLLSDSNKDHILRSLANRLLILYHKKYNRTMDIQDAKSGISFAELSLRLDQSTHFHVSNSRGQLSKLYLDMFKYTRDHEYIKKATIEARECVKTCPESTHANHNFANMMLVRYGLYHASEDLDEALKYITILIKAFAVDPRLQYALWASAGEAYSLQYEALKDANKEEAEDYLAKSIEYFSKASTHAENRPLGRIWAARYAAKLLARQSAWDRAHDILHQAMDLIPRILPIQLKYFDQRPILESISGLAAEACSTAIACGRVSCAIEDLERGRAIIQASGHQALPEIDKLRHQLPDVYQEYCDTRDQLLGMPDQQQNIVKNMDNNAFTLLQLTHTAYDYYTLEVRMQKVLDKIRNTPGFEQFLLPMTAVEIQELCGDNTVVALNRSQFGAHAIIVKKNRLSSIALPRFPFDSNSRDQLEVMVKVFERTVHPNETAQSHISNGQDQQASILGLLTALWHHVAEPVTTELGWLSKPDLSDEGEFMEFLLTRRILWLPTGLYSRLPIHAAGRHLGDGRDTLLVGRTVVSTYISSFRMLRFAQYISKELMNPLNSGLFLSMESSPSSLYDKIYLSSAAEEAEMTTLETSSAIEWTILRRPTKSEATEKISTCTYLHVASHGVSNVADPVSSYLIFSPGPTSHDMPTYLTVREILALRTEKESVEGDGHEIRGSGRVRGGVLAFLSACSTAEHRVPKLLDESLTIGAAFQVAGFAHVIGHLWPAYQFLGPDFAREFWSAMLNFKIINAVDCVDVEQRERRDGWIAACVWVATLRTLLKYECFKEPLFWASFVHLGP